MFGSLDTGALLLSLVVSGIGLAFFSYGRRTQRIPQLVAGLLLMVYPYFTPTTTQTVVVGTVIGAGLWLALWWGD